MIRKKLGEQCEEEEDEGTIKTKQTNIRKYD